MLHCWSAMCIEARQESPRSPIMGLLFYLTLSQLMSGDGRSMLGCLCHCVVSIESCFVVHYSQILHSCVLLTLVFIPQNMHRKHIVAMPSGRLPVWRKVYIHPNSTKHLFNHILTFSLASVVTLGRAHVLYIALLMGDMTDAAQRNVRFIFFCNEIYVALAFLSQLGMTCQKTVKLKLFMSNRI